MGACVKNALFQIITQRMLSSSFVFIIDDDDILVE